MNILPFHLNIPTEIALERPDGILVQGRYGDRVMFTLVDGRVMYVPPFVASKIQEEAVAPGERFEVCKTQIKKGGRRSIEWIVRRLNPFEELACTTEPTPAKPAPVANGSGDAPQTVVSPAVGAPEVEPETQLECDLQASIDSIDFRRNGSGHKGPPPSTQPVPPTKLEHALKTAISAAYNAERFGAELGYVVRFDADAIKSMAITVLINMSGANHR